MINMFCLTSGIPNYYNQLLFKTDKLLDHSKKFLAKSKIDKGTSMKLRGRSFQCINKRRTDQVWKVLFNVSAWALLLHIGRVRVEN